MTSGLRRPLAGTLSSIPTRPEVASRRRCFAMRELVSGNAASRLP